jgi:hypothetical protein
MGEIVKMSDKKSKSMLDICAKKAAINRVKKII